MIRVASWPHWYAPNLYLPLFYEALEGHAIQHVPGLPLDARVLTDPRHRLSAVHLHWPYPYWRDGGRGPIRQLRRVLNLRGLLRRLHQHDLLVVWTVHNLEPHENPRLADRLAYNFLHHRVDLRIFHSEWARQQAPAGRKDSDTLVMPHGSYAGALPEPRPAAVTRQELGIVQDVHLLLAFGQVRPYKGFDHAVEAMRRLSPGRYQLIIAGRPVGTAGVELERAAGGLPHVSTLLRDLTEQELADLLEAADAVLLPYLKSSGSGALLHALTASRPVIASDLACFREVLDPEPLAGVMVTPGRAQSITAGIEACFTADPNARREAARRLADRYGWSQLVAPVADWLHANTAKGSA